MPCRICGAMLPSGTQACMRCGSPVYMPVSSPAQASAADATAFDPSSQRSPFSQYPPAYQGGPTQTPSPFGNPPAQTSSLNSGYSPYQPQPQPRTGALNPPQQQPPATYQQARTFGAFGAPSMPPQSSSPYNQSMQSNYQYGNSPLAAPGQKNSNVMPGNAPFVRTGQLNPMPGNVPVFSQGQGQGVSGSGNNGFLPPQQGQVAPSSFERPGGSTQEGSKKKSRALMIGVVLLVIVLIGGGATFVLNSTIGFSSNIPSGRTIDPLASTIITSAQTASGIDQQTYGPLAGQVTSTFKVNQSIYVTFKLNPSKYDVTKQKAYILVKFYDGNRSVINNEQPYAVSSPIDAAYFVAQYYIATDNGAAEIYWCRQANCSDRKLAQVIHFTVTH